MKTTLRNRTAKASMLSLAAAAFAVVAVALAALIVAVYVPQINSQNNLISSQEQQIIDQQHEIDSLNSTVGHLNDQVSDLQGKLAQYTASITTQLGVKDLVEDNTGRHYLYIRGEVINSGVTTAYNAGLHIVGYDVNHQVLIDLVASAGYGTFNDGFTSTTSFNSILPTQSQTAMITIYHQGTVVAWDITPVYSNTP